MATMDNTKLDKCLKEVEKITNSVNTKLESAKTDKDRDKIISSGVEELHKKLGENTNVSEDTLIALSSYFAYASAFNGNGNDNDSTEESTSNQIDGVLSMLGLDSMAHVNDSIELIKKLKTLPTYLKSLGTAAKAALPYAAIIAAVAAVSAVAIKLGTDASSAAEDVEDLVEEENKTQEQLAAVEPKYNVNPNLAFSASTISDSEGFNDGDTTFSDVMNGNKSLWNFITDKLGKSKYSGNIVNDLKFLDNSPISEEEILKFNEIYSDELSKNMGEYIYKNGEFSADIKDILGTTVNGKNLTKDSFPKFDSTDLFGSMSKFIYFYYYVTYSSSSKVTESEISTQMSALYKSIIQELTNQLGRTEWIMSGSDIYNTGATYTGGIKTATFISQYNAIINKKLDPKNKYEGRHVHGCDDLYIPDLKTFYVNSKTPPGVDETDTDKLYRWWFNSDLAQDGSMYDEANKMAYIRLESDREMNQTFSDFTSNSAQLITSYNKDIEQTNEYIKELGFTDVAKSIYASSLDRVYSDSGFVGFTDATDLVKNLSELGYVSENGTIDMTKLESDVQTWDNTDISTSVDHNGKQLSKKDWQKFIDSYKNNFLVTNTDSLIDSGTTTGTAELIYYGQDYIDKNTTVQKSTDLDITDTSTQSNESVKNDLNELKTQSEETNKAALQSAEDLQTTIELLNELKEGMKLHSNALATIIETSASGATESSSPIKDYDTSPLNTKVTL